MSNTEILKQSKLIDTDFKPAEYRDYRPDYKEQIFKAGKGVKHSVTSPFIIIAISILIVESFIMFFLKTFLTLAPFTELLIDSLLLIILILPLSYLLLYRSMFNGTTMCANLENKLRDMESKFKTVFENSGGAIFIADVLTGKIIDCNLQAEELIGRLRRDIIGMHQSELHPENEKGKYIERFTTHVRESHLVDYEGEVKHRDGSRIPVWISAQCMKMGNRDVIMGLFVNITELKRNEKTIRESEERFQKFASAVTDVIYRYDPKSNRYDFISHSFESQTGYSLEEIRANPSEFTKKITHPDDVDRVFKEVADHIKKGSSAVPIVTEYRVVRKDGKIIWVNDIKSVEFSPDGKIYRINGVVSDTTERKQAEKLLQQSEYRYRTLIETIHDGVGITDLDENIIFANKGTCNVFGYPQKELTGMNLDQIIIKEEMDKIYKETQKRKNKEHSQYEVTIKRKDGQLRHIFLSASPFLDSNGNVIGTVGVFTDITELKKSEEEKQQLKEKLVRAQRMESLGVLAGGVAHDLNNILGPLVAYPELIMMKLPSDTPIKKQISQIAKSAQRAADIVQDLLTMARRGRYEMTSVDLNEIVESYLRSPDFFDIKSKFPNVEIEVDLETNLPRTHGSNPHLSKMIMNLIVNALDSMPHGGKLKIKTKCKNVDKLINGFDNINNGKYIILTVSDTGIGIDKKDLKRIFEPFYTKKEMGRSGSGLGLAIVYGVVKDHNGYIDVQSRANKGSKFIVYIPAVDVTADSKKNNVIDIRGSEKILVVDDVSEQRELAACILSSLGYEVDTIANGREAVEYINKNLADVVILDMIMENDFDGLDTYREIIKHKPGQKAIITSGFSETIRVKEAEKLGVGAYLKKPYTMQKLGKAIREVLIS
jgi:two-component system cell cycle sensor histidine kinase/response regulator CckA